MSQKTSIEWTDATWNPIKARLREDLRIATKAGLKVIPAGKVGYHCERISPGCGDGTGGGCYAESGNCRTLPAWGTGLKYNRPARDKVEVFLDHDVLIQPLKWKSPTKIFPCSMTDWCAEFVPDHFRDRMLIVAVLSQQHEYYYLTKRADNLLTYFNSFFHPSAEQRGWNCCGWMQQNGFSDQQIEAVIESHFAEGLRNVRLGVSVENQHYADLRLPVVAELGNRGWNTMVSCEPLLGDVALPKSFLSLGQRTWVIAGGESGRGARPCHPSWARTLRDQCVEAGVPFFWKQWGHLYPVSRTDGIHELPFGSYDTETRFGFIRNVEKSRLLDGVEWSQVPTIGGRHA